MFTHYELMLLQAVERERHREPAAPPRRRRRLPVPRWVTLAGRRGGPPPASSRDPAVSGGREMPAAGRPRAGNLAACASGGRIR